MIYSLTTFRKWFMPIFCLNADATFEIAVNLRSNRCRTCCPIKLNSHYKNDAQTFEMDFVSIDYLEPVSGYNWQQDKHYLKRMLSGRIEHIWHSGQHGNIPTFTWKFNAQIKGKHIQYGNLNLIATGKRITFTNSTLTTFDFNYALNTCTKSCVLTEQCAKQV